jgi:hypothetical protein
MATIDEIPKTYSEAVCSLVDAHTQAGPEDLSIVLFPDSQQQMVRLILISSDFQETGAVRPFPLGRSAEFPFRSAVALVTPEEWAQVEAARLRLPDEWDLATARKVWP